LGIEIPQSLDGDRYRNRYRKIAIPKLVDSGPDSDCDGAPNAAILPSVVAADALWALTPQSHAFMIAYNNGAS
jgi:hypothetical protein